MLYTVEDENEEMREMMARSFDAKTPYWREKDRVKCLPLWVEAGNENRCTGVLALKIALPVEREDDRLMLELVAGYVAIIVYNAVVLMAQKYRDIESAQDDARRAYGRKTSCMCKIWYWTIACQPLSMRQSIILTG